MGVELGNLTAKQTISLESLSGKIIAVDTYNMLYQFLASIRQEDGTPLMDFKGNPTAHLSGLFYRTVRLLENGIKPVFVFDGKAHQLKQKTQAERVEAKSLAAEKWKKAIEEERVEDFRKYAQATSRLTGQMVMESKMLLDAMGVPTVQAPSDGEAQAAMMVQNGIVYGVGSQDYDSLLFGSERLIRNISITGRRKVPRQDKFIIVEPEEIKLSETLKNIGIGKEQLIMIGLMVGTDFNEGIKGIGPKKALKIVKEKNIKNLSQLLKYLEENHEYQFEVDAEEVFEIFANPPYREVEKLSWENPKEDEIFRMLVTEHDFSEERVRRTVEQVVKTVKEKGAQSKLDQWF